MAKLKTEGFDIEISYFDINECDEIVYSLELFWKGKPFLNPTITSDFYKENNKFLISDCWDEDWLMKYFIEILQTKKGREMETFEEPVISFETITWENKKEEKKRQWKNKTIAVKKENGEIVDEPYWETVKPLMPIWENQIEFKIGFSHQYFIRNSNDGNFTVSAQTTFPLFIKFVESLQNEMKLFFEKHSHRVKYTGNGEYKILETEIKE